MIQYTHGGDIYGRKEALLDFSANLNPLGMPEAVRQAAEASVSQAACYPDALCQELTAAIARHDGVPSEWVLCGNGAADLMFRLAFAQKPRSALVMAPTFSEYAQALAAAGCAVSRHMLTREEAFDLTPRVLQELGEGLDLVFLCNPNNPTGRLIPQGLLEEILDRCAQAGVLLAVDECFLELAGGEGMAGKLADFPNLILFRAFTKSYAIPGLRLGYCLSSDQALLEGMWAAGQPWSVSTTAQAAGIAALEACSHWPVRARELLSQERPYLIQALADLGLDVIPGAANYLLFRAPGCPDLKQRLIKRGVLIRSCANYPGLDCDDYRVAVRGHGENQILIRAMKEAISYG